MSLTLVPPAPSAPVAPRDRLRPRLLLCIQAFQPDLLIAWDDNACLRGALGGQARELVRLCEVVEDEFRITITPTDMVQLALDGVTMGRLLDLVEAHVDGCARDPGLAGGARRRAVRHRHLRPALGHPGAADGAGGLGRLMTRRARPVQPDLLDWQAPQAYPPEAVRAATVAGRISRAVAFTLRHCGLKRQDIAARMAAYLGEPVSPAMLDAYASQARGDHNISAVRLLALAHATGDMRLLDMLCEPLGFAVIDRRLLPMLELADTHEQIETLRRRQDGIRRLLRDGAR